jgi:predicted aspartyl protease
VSTRRAFLGRVLLLAAGGAALFAVRDRLPWPPLNPRFADGRATPWLPLTPRPRLIEIAVAVNGTPIRAIVDSGAQLSAVDAGLAERIGLPRTLAAPIVAYGVGGGPRLAHTVHLDLALPGLAIGGVRAAALDLARIAAVTGRDFSLLIGRDVLRRLVVEADFPRERARFLAPDAYRPQAGAVAIPLGHAHGAATATVRIEGGPPLDLLVDTGASGEIALSEAAAQAAGLLAPGRPVRQARSVGLGGLNLDRIARASTVQLGPLAAHGVDIQIYAAGAHAPAPTGLLGAGFMRPFRAALDLGGRRLYLTRPGVLIVPQVREPTA